MAESKSAGPVLGADPAALKNADGAKGDVKERMDAANEQGFFGEKVDPTPNERYSLESNNWKTPETDPKLAAQAHLASRFPNHLPSDLAPGAEKSK